MPVAEPIDLAGRGEVCRQAQNIRTGGSEGLESLGIGTVDDIDHDQALAISASSTPSSAAMAVCISRRSSADLNRT